MLTSTPGEADIRRFIRRFTEHGHQVEECFTQGCCYWFAWVLTERFGDSKVVSVTEKLPEQLRLEDSGGIR